jgi:putative tricarboxylic transport membrane protein
MDAFITGFGLVLQPIYMLYMFAGMTIGVVIGVLPGLTGGMAIAIMLPFTFAMDSLSALVFLLSIYTGGLFGGAVTAVMLNAPGSPSNIATVLDGYPMNLKGEAGRALGLSLSSSIVGGLLGSTFLLFAAEPLAGLSLRFGPGEMFMVAIFGLSVVGSLSNNVFKALFAGAFGILLGTVGMSTTGAVRGTMGTIFLLDGIPLAPALIGLLALPEIFALPHQKFDMSRMSQTGARTVWRGIVETLRHPLQLGLCSLLGVFIGVMPAAGATIGSMVGYNQSKQWCKNSKEFGTGAPQGVIASETTNSATQGGALATMFVLGIPAGQATAMMMGALIIQGWQPGPRLFIDHREIIYASFSSLFVQQFILLLIGFLVCVCAAQLLRIPILFLVPSIMVFCVLGAFANRNTLFDVYLMIGFALIGWFMKKNDFPVMPVILGLILGPLADVQLLLIYQSFDSFFEIFERPIVVVLFLVTVFCIVVPAYLIAKRSKA